MSQVSYGTITITDTNDIESITVEYNRNQSSSSAPSATDSGWSTTRPDWAQGYYIWQRTRVHKSGTTADKDVIGTAVCITGSTGSTGAPGRGLTDTTTQYCNYGAGEPADNYSGWTDAPPSYDSSKPNYWVMITNTYSAAPTPEHIKYKDEALTKAVADAAIANSVAQHANEDAQGAMAQAVAAQQQVTQIDTLLGGHFLWHGSALSQNTKSGARVVEQTTKSGIDVSANPAQWLHNVNIGANGIQLRYNEAVLAQLAATNLDSSDDIALKFYQPPTISGDTTTQGNLTMALKGNALTFYNPTVANGQSVQATLDANGLKLLKGGIEAGTPSESNFIYLSTNDYPLRQFIHTSDISIDTNKEYYELSNNEFVLVEEPEAAAIANYYEISIDGIAINGHIPTEISVENRDIPWRQIIGNNFGVDADGNLYATGVNISGKLTVTGGNVYTKDETDNNLNNTINEAINNIDNNVIYAYSANSDGTNYSYDNSNLQYRGIFVTNQKDGVNPIVPPEKHYEKTSDIEIYEDKVYYELVVHEGVQEYIQVDNPSVSDIDNYYEFINEEPNKFQWEVNPIYAEQHASNYIADFQGGIKISAASNTTNAYLSLTAVLMQFWLNQRSMAQFGYDSIYESYGISVENVMITGAGNALRLDNGLNGTYQGQFILETRSNGHLSLKPGLSRTEEEEI